MQQEKQQEQQALAQAEPQFVLVAGTEQGYLAIAQKLHQAGLLPRGKEGQMDAGTAAICMMYGREFGLSPLKSIYGIAPIKGKPAPYGATLRGICEDTSSLGNLTGCLQGVGEMRHVALEEPEGDGVDAELGEALRRAVRRRLARLGWTYDESSKKWTREGGPDVPANYRCGYAAYKRKGRPVRVELFDSQEAHTANLLGNSGPWTTFPQRMLEARAVMFALKALYADKLTGLQPTVEELEVIDTTAVEVKPPASATVLDELAAAPKPASGPAPVDVEFTEHAREPSGPQPAAEQKSEKPPTGAEILRAAVARIKVEGGKASEMHEDACKRAGIEPKSSKVMNDTEMRKVAAALEVIWSERQAQPSLPAGGAAAAAAS